MVVTVFDEEMKESKKELSRPETENLLKHLHEKFCFSKYQSKDHLYIFLICEREALKSRCMSDNA